MTCSHFGILSLAAASLTFAAGLSPLTAADESESSGTAAVGFDADAAADAAKPAELLSFNYKIFFRRSTQLGLLTQELGYTVTIAPDGTASDCTLSRSFRSPLTAKEICRTIMRAAEFAPARDAAGNPTSGSYQGEVKIWSPFAATQ